MQSPQKSPFGSRRKDANKLTEKPESPTESTWMWPCSGFLLWLLLRYLNGLGEGYTTGWLNHSGFFSQSWKKNFFSRRNGFPYLESLHLIFVSPVVFVCLFLFLQQECQD